MSNGTIDADGAQVHGAERVSGAHGAQVVGSNGSMDSRGISGAGAQPGAAEEVMIRPPDVVEGLGTGNIGAEESVTKEDKPANWGGMTSGQRRLWFRNAKKRRDRKLQERGGN